MLYFLLWYLSISIIGWLSFPLAYRLLPGLPDRGYTFSRGLGWLLWGYIFWLLASLGILQNDAGGLLFALILLLALSIWAIRSAGWTDLLNWLRSRIRYVLGVEALFFIAFAGWTIVRAANPDIFGTEKPMELAFINAILHSPTFPPHDPWLSGYAISYYYFGYVLVAMLAKWTGVPGSVAFNLGVSLVFALSALGAYGVVYNLLAGWAERRRRTEDGGRMIKDEGRTTEDEGLLSSSVVRPSSYALLGPFFVLLVSNLEGFLEVLHARGLFSAAFWKWLDIPDINTPPMAPFSWLPRLFGTGNWWWWRASRVVQDYDLAGSLREIIDEFPFFSYLLADLHPHVLAMPFAFLAMALALNIFWSGAEGRVDVRRRVSVGMLALTGVLLVVAGFALFWSGLSSLSLRPAVLGLASFVSGMILFAGVRPENGNEGTSLLDLRGWGQTEIGISLSIDGPTFLLSAVVLGGLAFLNTWDFPFYVALFAGAYSLSRTSGFGLLKSFLSMALALGLLGVLLYLPFYLGFSSQAGGILPNLIYPTRGAQFWVMFAPLLLPLIIYLLYLWKAERASSQFKKGLLVALGLSLGLWALSLLLGLGIISIPSLGDFFLSAVLAAPNRTVAITAALSRRLSSPGGWITMVALLVIVLTLLIAVVNKERGSRGAGELESGGAEEQGSGGAEGVQGSKIAIPYPLSPILSSHTFVLLLVLLGLLLALGPEFFYLRDQFGYRINTIFKFYYQSWLLWSMAAAFGTAVLLLVLRRIPALLFSISLVLLLGMALTYTVFGLWDKTSGFNPPAGWTLDGTAYLARQNPDEMAAVGWLSSAVPGTVAEAVGGSYSAYARISMLSGQPAVLGWPGHELQWRGGGKEIGSRQADIERLYCTRDWTEAQSIIKQYDIRYIYIGGLERSTYVPSLAGCPTGLNEAKFSRNLNQVFKQGDSVIYSSH